MSSVVAIANSGAGMVVGKPGSGFVWRTLPSVSGTHKEAQGDLLEAEQELLPGSRLTFVTTSPPRSAARRHIFKPQHHRGTKNRHFPPLPNFRQPDMRLGRNPK